MSLIELREAAAKASAKVWSLEAKERAEKAQSLVGRAFRFRNSYGSDSKWWLYAMVHTITKDGHILVHEFQTTSRHEMQINFRREHYYHLLDGYQEITKAEFRKEWRALKKRIASHD